MPTSKGRSLHIGVNSVNPAGYNGLWSGNGLTKCERDAIAMYNIAYDAGFTAEKLLTAQATRTTVKKKITDNLDLLDPGDIFVLTFSGHGGQVPDTGGDEPRPPFDGLDETWGLRDGQLVDDELYALLAPHTGVRIVVVVDACHSGSSASQFVPGAKRSSLRSAFPVTKEIPEWVAIESYERYKSEFDRIQADNPHGNDIVMGSQVLLISACQDKEVTLEGDRHGVFTGQLLDVWNAGRFRNYKEFYLRLPVTAARKPNYYIPPGSNTTFDTVNQVFSI